MPCAEPVLRTGDSKEPRREWLADLARSVDVSRQTIYAIEAGTYVPNTEVALNLARELEVTVEELFSLHGRLRDAAESLARTCSAPSAPAKGPAGADLPHRFAMGERSGERFSVLPAGGRRHDHDACRARRPGRVRRRRRIGAQKRLVLAGCDPATGLLARMVERISGVEIVSAAASSKFALTGLSKTRFTSPVRTWKIHLTGEFNLPFIRKMFPDEEFIVVTFAQWEEGLVVAAGNPKGSAEVEDLARRECAVRESRAGFGEPRAVGQAACEG